MAIASPAAHPARVCTAQFVKETASRLVDSAPVDTRPVLAVIVHFPPEMAQLGPVATTVPTSGWRYVSGVSNAHCAVVLWA